MSSSFHASTVDWLGSWIAAGQVKPGQTIKVEADLGEQLGVSRTVVPNASYAARAMDRCPLWK